MYVEENYEDIKVKKVLLHIQDLLMRNILPEIKKFKYFLLIIKVLNISRTNFTLGSYQLYYKGASPFQYNLDSRNTSDIQVNESFK